MVPIARKKVGDKMAFYKSAEDYYKEMTSTITDVDTSEHSLIYAALMPACYELSYQSLMLDEVTKRVFAKSALENGYYDDLKNRCLEMGIEQKLATTATGTIKITGKINSKLPSGVLVSTALGITYLTQSDVIVNSEGIGYTGIIASDKGSKYNANVGDVSLLPVKYEGIYGVTNESKIDNGYDDETYEALYNRYLLKIQTPATSGNKYHYEQWALEVTGVGFAKCIPGAGNVKVIIANSNKRAANDELIKEVYSHINEVRPILAGILTVVTVKEITINITANVEIDSSVILGDVQNIFASAAKEYLSNKVYTTKKVSLAKLGGILVDIDGVVDYAELKINNGTSNITLGDEEIAVIGSVSLGVI
ncbi:baseplate J/gp47 family protein [Clostridium beijerinckii]|uniref:baseplate J/gp47 family protein n=1 Tax=Clostridium beijerinckii TaxID=1520 RepID=UPI00232FCEB7|nr:baseplate J/gp47 family protein [Clostridium beijerinckii]